MKRFLITFSIFTLALATVSPLSLLLPYKRISQANRDFYAVVEKSKRKTKKKKLIIGDSVSGQLFPYAMDGKKYTFSLLTDKK
ncbi:hypothetical protein [Olivibacter sitiensis]|uniref:hypothetical protein n=1 Tax=Olivibacter sitiensis TaxID=376470 RepID=UPI000489C2A4|nr:hypothetical protein [Olivibacter sitiensis]